MAFAGGSKGVKNDINVTPLVDVCLVLLIIFMVITPMLQRGKPVKLPTAHMIDKEKSTDPLVVSITTQKEVYVETERVHPDAVADKVSGILKADTQRKILLKADEKLTVGDVREVMNKLKNAGTTGVALGVEEAKK